MSAINRAVTQFDVNAWRESEFPITREYIYLDNAAMSPLPTRVRDSIASFHEFRSLHGAAFDAWWDEVEMVRSKVAALIGSHPDEISFTQNTSMGLNLLAQGLPLQRGDNVIISDLEFPSNVYPWMNLQHKGIEVRFVRNKDGRLSISDMERLVDKKTKLISLSFVEAGNGFKNDLKVISNLCKQHDIFFVVDAIQGLGVQKIDVEELQIDFLVSGFFKWLCGPDGLGFVYCSKKMLDSIDPPFVSWTSMEDKFNYSTYDFNLSQTSRRFETGNLNFSAIRGVHKGLDLLNEVGSHIIYHQVMELANYIRSCVSRLGNVTCLSNFDEANQSHILLLQCSDVDDCFERLKQKNIIVNKRNGLRISPHFYNTKEEIDQLLDIIIK
ncbi:aminotransferase class V-fold PLP-dependent enzyme [Aneurinibacillus sp. REN35]|uniref:aminotransferase class V-fold PLP-dependent enzyme n=1 Tax=Aneurinibacillus sp. REN35 TaxID=3237286 RepID=UPI0035278C7E